MNERDDLGPEFATRAEESLHEQLAVVRADPPQPGTDLSREVTQTLRWQALLVVPIAAVASIAGGILDGLRSLLGPKASAR